MKIILRAFFAWLWRFVIFRWAVLFYVTTFPSRFSDWLAINTPMHVGLRDLFLRTGDYANAAKLNTILREAGEL